MRILFPAAANLAIACVKLEADENAPQALRAAAKAWYENRDDAKLSHNLGYEFAEEAKKNADKCETSYVVAIRPRSFLRILFPAAANLAIAPIGVDLED